ncbi:MAG: zinc-dependent alcohol dehydrogenase family protein [Candidatus Elarobacter sp.]
MCHSDLSHIDGSLRKPFPLVLGHEAAGVVEALGAGVEGLREGDHVVFAFVPACGRCVPCLTGHSARCANGQAANAKGELLRGGTRFRLRGGTAYHHLGVSAFCERVVCAQESVVRIPADTPLEIASVFGCAALTGLGAVFNVARVSPGTSVAVFGAGGVGLIALLGAIAAGATQTIVVDPIASKRELARDLGAAATIDPASEDVPARIAELVGAPGADYAIEAAGSAPALEAAIAATAPGGTAVAVGLSRAGTSVSVGYGPLVIGEKTIRGSFMGSSVAQRDIPRYIRLWRAGRLPVERLISGSVSLDGLNAAFDRLANGEVVRTLCRL